MTCKDICIHHRAQKRSNRLSRYLNGQKRCQVCQLYLKWDGTRCPCCSTKLRINPRGLKYKTKMSVQIGNLKGKQPSLFLNPI
jgi:hypothetical protein